MRNRSFHFKDQKLVIYYFPHVFVLDLDHIEGFFDNSILSPEKKITKKDYTPRLLTDYRRAAQTMLTHLENGTRNEKQVKTQLKNSIFGFTADLVYDSDKMFEKIKNRKKS
jgi:hypothetical protein